MVETEEVSEKGVLNSKLTRAFAGEKMSLFNFVLNYVEAQRPCVEYLKVYFIA
jgi:hypothetical protein